MTGVGPTDGRRRANHFIYAVKGSPAEHCFTPHTAGEQPGVSYGYGFHILDDGRHGRVIGHGGRAHSSDAFALIYRDLGYTVIVLSNYDRPAARRIVDAIADVLIA